ncbi:MAG: phenylacetate--CoA ligase family protein [Acidimicrobiales bacterium]
MPQNGPEVLGPTPRDPSQLYWDPDAQTMDPEARRELQDRRLRQLLAKIFEIPVPLFERKLRAAGIENPEDVKGVEDISAIPLTVKQDLRDSEAAIPPWGDYRFTDPHRAVRLGTSTGTTGTPTITLWTRHDLWIEYESAARTWWRYGHRPGMIVTHAHPAYLYGGGAMLSGAYEYFGFLNIWVPPPDTDELAEQGLRFWTRVKPDIPFMGFSTGRFFEVAAKLGIDPLDAGLEFKGLPGFGLGKGMPLMTAGAECYAYVGGACGQAPGAHVCEDWAIVQAVDPETGREVPDGEWGNLVVTTLDRDNGLLRYDLEEACAVLREPCPCGETTMRALWGGRFKDLISTQGKRFQASELESALRSVPGVSEPTLEWQLVRPRPGKEDRPLQVRVERGASASTGDDGGAGAGDLAKQCVGAVREALGIEADVKILPRESIPRSGYKAARVVDE